MEYRPILIAAAQVIGLFVAGGLIPPLGQILALFTPVPLILVLVRNGRQAGLITLFVSGVMVTLLGGWQGGAILVLSFGLMAIGIAEGMRMNARIERTTLMGGLLPVVVLGVIVVFFLFRMGRNPMAEVDSYLRESIATASQAYAKMGLKEMAAMVSSIPDPVLYYFARLIPSFIIATSVMQAACCYGIARVIIARRPGPDPLPPQAPVSSWHAPDSWVWGLIAALALVVVPQENVRLLGWNLGILFALVYLSQGAAVIDHYLRKALLKPVLRGLLMGLILATPAIVFVIALGIVDIWADFRKVRLPDRAG